MPKYPAWRYNCYMGRPLIGITLDIQESVNSRGVLEKRYWLKQALVGAVLKNGGEPLLLPFISGVQRARQVMEALDGLLISGGDFDIEPKRYGEKRRKECGPAVPERTESELMLLAASLAGAKPVLGICGGCQVINVHFGGTLYQDIPSQKKTDLGHSQTQPHARATHRVAVAAKTRLAAITGAASLAVNSTHHQAVKIPGRGLVPSAVSADGVIEGIEAADGRFIVGVQWHPEFLIRLKPHAALFRALTRAAAARKRHGALNVRRAGKTVS